MEKLQLPDLTQPDALSFLFYQIPQALVDDEVFSSLDGWAIILYSLMLNRAGLSVKNKENFTDENGRLYIIFTVDEVIKRCRCGKNVAIKLLHQLEEIGLIEKNRQGLGRPSLIYVKNFAYYNKPPEFTEFKKQTSDNSSPIKKQTSDVYKKNSRSLKNKQDKFYKTNTNHNHTNLRNHTNHIKPNHIYLSGMNDTNDIKANVKKNIDLYNLQFRYPYKHSEIQELYEIITEVLASRKKVFRIAKEDMPADVVKQAFASLNSLHIEYVLESLSKNTSQVKSIKSYLQTALFNATKTIYNHTNLDVQESQY